MMGIGIGEHVVEIKDGHVVERVVILAQPVVHQPLVEGARVGRIGRVAQWRRGDDNKELIRAGGKIFQDFVVDIFRSTHRHIFVSARRIIWIPVQFRVRETGFEHDDLVLAAGVRQAARVGRILFAFIEKRVHISGCFTAAEPFHPVWDVGAVADAVRPPAIVGIADEVVVLTERAPQVTVAIRQPVLTGGVMDEDEFYRLTRRVRIFTLRWRCWIEPPAVKSKRAKILNSPTNICKKRLFDFISASSNFLFYGTCSIQSGASSIMNISTSSVPERPQLLVKSARVKS